jgi:hypothetical protein
VEESPFIALESRHASAAATCDCEVRLVAPSLYQSVPIVHGWNRYRLTSTRPAGGAIMRALTNILCGTDFSEGAGEAARVAAAWAACHGAEVHLAHVIDDLGAEHDFNESDPTRYGPRRARLEQEAEA